MTQALYAHMNNKKKMLRTKERKKKKIKEALSANLSPTKKKVRSHMRSLG
jgi:hypothetical protein